MNVSVCQRWQHVSAADATVRPPGGKPAKVDEAFIGVDREDDEGTLDEEEYAMGGAAEKEEATDLAAEAEMPLEQLLASYGLSAGALSRLFRAVVLVACLRLQLLALQISLGHAPGLSRRRARTRLTRTARTTRARPRRRRS